MSSAEGSSSTRVTQRRSAGLSFTESPVCLVPFPRAVVENATPAPEGDQVVHAMIRKTAVPEQEVAQAFPQIPAKTGGSLPIVSGTSDLWFWRRRKLQVCRGSGWCAGNGGARRLNHRGTDGTEKGNLSHGRTRKKKSLRCMHLSCIFSVSSVFFRGQF